MGGTNVISGLSSGLDWRTIIDQLKAIEHRRIDLVESRKKTYQNRISAWQNLNKKFLSLKTAAETLNKTTSFNLYKATLASNTTTDPEALLSVSTGDEAAPGTYQIKIEQLATAQKLSSNGYASQTESLGLSGDLIVGGRTVKVASTDSLVQIRDKINGVNTGTNASGVTASVVNYGAGGYRLVLTSDREGAQGISLQNGGASDLVELLGFLDASPKTAKNTVAGGHLSDRFSAADQAIGGADLLDLTSPASGTVSFTLNGVTREVLIDLATDSLNTIRDAINSAFSGAFTSDPASIVTETTDGTTRYRLFIEGATIDYSDQNNVLETLGFLKKSGTSAVRGLSGDLALTTGGKPITASTRLDEIDGYLDYGSGDTILLSGTDTNGNVVNTVFSIYDGGYKTIGDLLAAIEAAYGDVTASITAEGKIQVVDDEVGDDQLSVILTPSRSSLRFDTDGDLGAISTLRVRELQAGSDATLILDGVTLHPTTNTVSDLIPGVTLSLKKEDPDTTITLAVNRDEEGIKEKVLQFINAYNETIEAINDQLTYNADPESSQAPLFGDGTLRSLRALLSGTVLGRISGASDDFSTVGMAGVSLGKDGKLTLDESRFQDALTNHFDDLRTLFSVSWSSTTSHLTYILHTKNTQAGTYNLQITSLDPLEGYFVTPGDARSDGDYLTGLSGDVDGLMVRYTGSETGAVGSLTLRFGVAELLSRGLEAITDPVNGYLTEKNRTIQDAITNLDHRIQTMEDRLEQKMATLEKRFIAMETALSKLQSQSGWLSSQINAINQGWR